MRKLRKTEDYSMKKTNKYLGTLELLIRFGQQYLLDFYESFDEEQ